MTFFSLTYQAWVQQFKPIKNPKTGEIAFDTHDDAEFLRSQPKSKIWTLIDCDEKNTSIIIEGCRWVNRVEYYVTEVEHNEADQYNID